MTPAHGLLALFAALAISQDSKAQKLSMNTPFPKVTASVPGHRRAKQPEITPAMYEKAVAAVQPGATKLGDVLYFDGFAVAMETHYNDTKGAHKGASIFVPS